MSNNPDLQLSEVFNVKGKVALVTGGGSGIGLMVPIPATSSHHNLTDPILQCTQALAVNGAKVYIVGRTEEKLQRVKKVHGKDIAGEIIPLVGDVADKKSVDKLVSEIESKEGKLDILVNSNNSSYSTVAKHV
ncbi:hypothetical protein LTR28_009780 [Elasticomyces elasticus]|nr:hypothetical protein LTR28_009780 [Elasticomyces elasticus]